ncbi:MAG: hypothetical protein K9H25_19525 [Rhodospirillum sp.]|nr:hypothetical protein [Rhodospirillum sp.]MCF8488657.1 hypothetical protein [Rhodospirillum sp.]MCF8501738.1 hypothetical protein [Rhodospirillum sp.]
MANALISSTSAASTPGPSASSAVKAPATSARGSGQTEGTPSPSPDQGSTVITLSAAARSLTARSQTTSTQTASGTDANAQNKDAKAVDDLARSAQAAATEADSLQAALDELEKSFEKLLRAFGLSDEDAVSGAKAGRAAVKEAAQATQGASDQPSFRVTSTQTLVVEAREVSFTLTQEGEDGSSTSVTASVQSVSVSYMETTTMEAMWNESDPLVLDLDGNGFDLESGATGDKSFDMDGDGTEERTSWVAGEDAFLAMDRNGDGAITSGQELFGDQHGAQDGFAELSKLDSNADGAIDAQDKDWGSLLLLKADGSTQSLGEAGITRINLDAIVPMDNRVGNAGRLTGLSTFERNDGQTSSVGNFRLDVQA